MVGEEDHHALLAIDLHARLHPAQPLRVALAAGKDGEHDLVIAQDFALRLFDPLFDDAIGEAFLGARDPEDPAHAQVPQVREVHVGFVEKHDLPSADARAEFARAFSIVLTRRVDDRTARQLAAQVQPAPANA